MSAHVDAMLKKKSLDQMREEGLVIYFLLHGFIRENTEREHHEFIKDLLQVANITRIKLALDKAKEAFEENPNSPSKRNLITKLENQLAKANQVSFLQEEIK